MSTEPNNNELKEVEEYFSSNNFKKEFCKNDKCVFYRDGMKISIADITGFANDYSENEFQYIVNVTGGFWRDKYAMGTKEVQKLLDNIPNIENREYLTWDWE